MYLPANPTARRREETLRIRARLEAMDAQLDYALVMGKEVAVKAAAFSPADVDEVGRLLVEGRVRLPTYARITVTTEVEEIKDKLFNTSTQVITHTCDQLCCHQMQPMSIQAAIERKLLTKVGGQWLFRADVYRTMVPADPRLIS
jgi:hypothetical protein